MDTKNRLIALLDANVLYPASLRSFFLYLADEGLYDPKWTTAIHEEWIRGVLRKRGDLTKLKLENVRSAMDAAFPDANVTGYEALIPGFELPDENDRHVLAAAIKASANLLVTQNLKDFPKEVLRAYNLELCTPDELVMHFLDIDSDAVDRALNGQVRSLKNPPISKIKLLTLLKANGLKESVKRFMK